MLDSHELFDSITMDTDIDRAHWSSAITALSNCQETVTACSGAMVMLTDDLSDAVMRDLDCADVVQATARVLNRATDMDHALLSAQLEACVMACERSHELCSRHAEHHAHCRLCAAATTQCAQACRELLAALHR